MVGRKAICVGLIFLADQAFGRDLFDVTKAKGIAEQADCRIQKKGDALKPSGLMGPVRLLMPQ